VPGAIAEALLRDDRRPTAAVREIRQTQLHGLVMTEFRAPSYLPLVSLVGPDLGQLGQDVWLTKCEPDQYPETQLWGAAIRGWCDWSVGFVWRGRLNENEFACVMYAEAPSRPLEPSGDSIALDSEVGLELVRAVLLPHAVTVSDS
jgi:RES domain